MQYSQQPPTEPGYYWLENVSFEEIVELWFNPDDGSRRLWVHLFWNGEDRAVDEIENAHWGGPIPKPDRLAATLARTIGAP